jgi:hypothetical protein
MGHFVTIPSRQLLAQTEARMTHFVTLTVHSPRTDHSLRHSTTRVGLRARRVRILFFRENVRFGRFSWAIAHGFRHPGQFFRNLPDCHRILIDDILWSFDSFWDHRVHVPGLLRVISLPFFLQTITCSNGRQNDTFRHSNSPFSTYRTKFKAYHNLSRSPGQTGSNFIFSRKRPFRAIFVSYSTRLSAPGFRHPGQLFENFPVVTKYL